MLLLSGCVQPPPTQRPGEPALQDFLDVLNADDEFAGYDAQLTSSFGQEPVWVLDESRAITMKEVTEKINDRDSPVEFYLLRSAAGLDLTEDLVGFDPQEHLNTSLANNINNRDVFLVRMHVEQKQDTGLAAVLCMRAGNQSVLSMLALKQVSFG